MARKFTKVLALMESKGGRVELTDPDLAALLGKLMYRSASYFSNIRRRAGLDVRAVRAGRKVVAYELGALATVPVPTSVTAAPAVDATEAA